ncbi:MAG: hypothetical protein WAU70_14845 [Flavobacteriales bacterium]
MPSITVRRPSGSINARIELPRSKSVAARAAIISSMALPAGPRRIGVTGPMLLHNYPTSDDSTILLRLLQERPREMHCGMGGTTFRFLLAWAAVQDGEEHLITGAPRLLERPHDALVSALRSLGADIEPVPEGYRVRGRRLQGGEVTLDAPVSSQFVSALMMIGPMMEDGLVIHWRGRKLSEPYALMTALVMRHFNAHFTIRFGADQIIETEHGGYVSEPFTVPTDWSAASFFYQVVALSTGAVVTFPLLVFEGYQGDEDIAKLFVDQVETAPWSETDATMRINGTRITRRTLRRVREEGAPCDLGATPDLFPVVAITHAALGREAHFTGLDNLHLKESDRLAAVVDVLHVLGIPHTAGPGSLELVSSEQLVADLSHRAFTFDPHDDHRMAMALAPLALVCESITLLDPDVVNKSYPGFWDDLAKAGFRLERRE